MLTAVLFSHWQFVLSWEENGQVVLRIITFWVFCDTIRVGSPSQMISTRVFVMMEEFHVDYLSHEDGAVMFANLS